MKHRGIFCLLFALFILALPQVILAGTVTWTGAGDGTSWSDPMNWSGNALPGTTADVTIGTISGNPTIQITAAAGAVQIHSLTSNQPITISNGSLTLASSSKINAILSVTGSASSLNAGPQTTLLADNISVDEGAQVSFPNVTSYAAPTGMSVQWSVQHSGSTLSFPNLTSIAGPTTPNTYLTLLAEYTDQGTGTNTSPEISLPALTTITKADDGDSSPDSGVALTAYSGGLISAPNLSAFNDNDSHPNSSLSASDGGTLSLPKLLAPKGVNINLNALSNPAQFTSLTGTANFEINAGTVVMSNLNTITGFSNITVDQGAQLSFPNVTSYVTPTGMSVQWLAEHSGSTLSFPNLTSIAGPTTPNTYLTLLAEYTDQGTGTNTSPEISLPALTSITKADDGDSSPDSGVALNAYSGGLISAPNLTTFNDNDSYPNSSLTASDGGTLSLPKLLAPKGVNINLNALSNPGQFTSLTGIATFEINAGTVVMSNLNAITGIMNITVDQGAQLSFPNVTSYTTPAGLSVQWLAEHSGSTLSFPNLTSIAGPATPNTYLTLLTEYTDQGTGTGASPAISMPALTAITKADDGDSSANSGVVLNAYSGGLISAAKLSTFNDNDSHPNSSLNATDGGTLSLPKLLAPKGVNIDLNALSNPGQFTSLTGTVNFEINAGTVVMSSLNTITGFSNITADQGAQLSFPNVTSYATPAGLSVQWLAEHSGSTLSFPNLTSIAGPATPNTYLNLVAEYTDQGTGTNASPAISLPALTAITKADDGDSSADSGVVLNANNGGLISAPSLTTFNDNDSHPNSSLTASSGGVISAEELMSVIGVNVNFGAALTIDQGQSFFGYGVIQDGVFNAGLIAINSPGETLQINGPLSSTGTVRVSNGGTLSIAGDFTLNDSGLLNLTAGSTLAVTGNFLGTTTNTSGADPLGTLLLDGGRSSLDPQLLEAMSRDLGAVAAGFTQNFVFGTLSLANNSYVQLVDRSRNTTSTSPECVYAETVIIPAGCTLDLNGLHLYARAVQNAGTVLHGTITQIPNAGALVLETPTPGALSAAGELDEWTFFLQAGRSVSVFVNPGATGFAAAISPQLQWANVQLLDSSNNVLASGFSANSGDIVSLQNIVVPADGTYKIHINAPASHTAAIGNYTVSAWDSTPNVNALTFDQQVYGNIAAPFAVDQWTFAAVAGQQVQFHVVSATPGLAFSLSGPNGYTGFTDLSGDSMLIDLPSSGSYKLNAYGLNGATGGYSFVLKQTSVTNLALSTAYDGSWAGSGQAQLFVVPVTVAAPLLLSLTDAASADHTEIYARFGAAPTRQTFDYAANGPGANHSLLVPSAAAGSWYVLVYGESIPSSSGSYALLAKAQEVFLSANSTGQSAANINTSITLTGAGFTSGSKVSFIGTVSGTSYAATSSSTDLPTQITATIAAGALPAGTYNIEVTQPDGSTAILPSSIIIAATGQGVLQTSIAVPNPIGRHISTTLYVTYSNVGNAAMPAPVLEVYGVNPAGLQGAFLTLDPSLVTQGFWTSAVPLGYSNSVQILASGDTPGVLQPGESKTVPVYYGGWISSQWNDSARFDFYVAPTHADDATPVNWAALESTIQPAAIPAAAWHIVYADLLSQLGATAGGYVQLLDNNAMYLGQLGRNVTDISKLWTFAVMQALNVFPTGNLAGATDGSLPNTGKIPLSFGRTFENSIPGRFQAGPFGLGWITPWQQSLSVASDGTVTISTGNGSRRMYQPDSRYAGVYFSQTGDYSTLTAVNGGYQLTAADGVITFFQSSGLLSYVQDPNGNTITATYSGGKLAALTSSSGASFTFAYNGAGLISALTDSAGRATAYTYDVTNQYLISVRSYNGLTTSYAYDTAPGSASLNALTTITFPTGLQENLSYDANGRLMGITANGGALPKAVAYSSGEVSITDSTTATTSVYFDENGQLAKTVDALGSPTFFDHDSNYNLSGVTNAAGVSAAYLHDNLGAVTAATDFLGHTTSFVYGGPQHELTELTDANGNNTQYAYNSTGQRTGTTFANGSIESSTFDPLGNALSFIDAAGEPIQYQHNAAGQLTSASFADGSSYTYAYDAEGDLTSATDSSGSTVFTYNSSGFLTKVAYPNGLSLTFTYDSAGRRASMADQTGFTTAYVYDALSRLSALKDGSANTIVSYTYDSNGRLSKQTNANGAYATYQYDAAGHLLHLINFAPGGTVNSRFDETYNSVGLKSGETTLDGAWSYTYDADGQLTHAVFATVNAGKVANQDLAYAYDAVGNRTSATLNGATSAYVTNNMNQYSSVGGVLQTYDLKGDLLSDGVNAYTYSTLNQLLGVANGSGTAAYTYNALGQRVSSSAGGQVTNDLVDPTGPGNTVGTFNAGGTLIADYRAGLGLVSEVTSGNSYFYDTDALGSVVGLSNASGQYVNAYSYSAFGGILASSQTINNPFQFIGAAGVMNSGTSLTSMGNRFYNSVAGRFLSSDPIGLSGNDVNLYRYVNNCPVALIDPMGTSAIGNQSQGTSKDILDSLAGAVNSNEAAPLDFVNSGEETGSKFSGTGSALTGAGVGIVFTEGLGQFVNDLEPKSKYVSSLPASPAPSQTVISSGYGIDEFGGDDGGGFGYGPYGPPGGPGNGGGGSGGSSSGSGSQDPNSLSGPAGYGTANFVTNMGNVFAYRVMFQNSPAASSPAQVVTISDQLDPSLNWSTFQLTGIGFADNNLLIPSGSQHYQTTVSMTYNGQTFNVQIEAGIHSQTGQVYATFESIDPDTGLPPSNVLTGFLPPENGTGRGDGYLTYTVAPKSSVANGTVIDNVAYITFDGNQPIATDQVNDDDPSQGIDPTKEAPVTIDATVPTAHITALPSHEGPNIAVSWSGADTGGSGIGSYTVYVSSDGGQTYTAWLANTPLTSGVYQGTAGHTYTFYVVATSNAGAVSTNGQAGAVSTFVDYAPQVTSALTAEVTQGQPFSYMIAASNTPTSFGATGLPAGLSVDTASGLISGAPTVSGVFSVVLSATNDGGTGTATLSLTVDPPPVTYPVINSATSAAAQVGQSFSYQITATNTPVSFGATGLPGGLSIDASSGLISGVPTASGVYSVSLSATNAGGTGTAALTLTVSPVSVTPPPPATVAPVINSVLAVNGQATVAFSYQITASNTPTSFGATGLPDGLSVDAASGLISGTPSTPGTYSITLAASNAAGIGNATLTLTVGPAPLPAVSVTATVPEVTVGSGLSGKFTLTIQTALAKDLNVTYALKGTAIDGTDYQMLIGTKVIKAGKTKANVKVVPMGDLGGASKKTVKLILESKKRYTVGTAASAKVKILAAP